MPRIRNVTLTEGRLLDWFDLYVPQMMRPLVALRRDSGPRYQRVGVAAQDVLEALERLADELADALPPIEVIEKERRRRNEQKELEKHGL